jgi:hypothetical protein
LAGCAIAMQKNSMCHQNDGEKQHLAKRSKHWQQLSLRFRRQQSVFLTVAS